MKLSNKWEIQLVVPAWPAFRGQVPSEAWGCYLVSDKLSHLFYEKFKVFFLGPCRQIYQEESHESFNGIPVWERTLLDGLIFSWRPGNINFDDREISVLTTGKYQNQSWWLGNIHLDKRETSVLKTGKYKSWWLGNISFEDKDIRLKYWETSVMTSYRYQSLRQRITLDYWEIQIGLDYQEILVLTAGKYRSIRQWNVSIVDWEMSVF